MIVRRLLAFLILCYAAAGHSWAATPTVEQEADCVVLLHGLARTYRSMSKIENALTQIGYRVANVDYLSRERRIEELAQSAVTRGIERCKHSGSGTSKIHFVTHSI